MSEGAFGEAPLLDWIVLSILAIAVARGLFIGLIREGLSIVALAAAAIATRLFVVPLAGWLGDSSGGEIGSRAALWFAGALLILGTVLAVGFTARLLRRGARFAGLGWADRVGGGALGLAEGGLVAAGLVLLAVWLVGPTHPSVEGARSLAAVEELRRMQREGRLPEVAAPGRWQQEPAPRERFGR